MFRKVLLVLIILVNIGCDQVSKELVRDEVAANAYIELAGKYLVLTNVENTGAFLGFGSSLSPILKNILLLGLPTIMLLALTTYMFRSKKTDFPTTIAFGFILGGGFGNLYDRFVHGSVTDFVHINLGFVKTGIFNMADVSVTVGILFLFFYNISTKMPKSNRFDQ
ncbi:signal peptidase II [Flavobacteriaceae bacterium M23B6Z8]